MDADSLFDGNGGGYQDNSLFWIALTFVAILSFIFGGPIGIIVAAAVYYYWKENKKKGEAKGGGSSTAQTGGQTAGSDPIPGTSDGLGEHLSSLVDGPQGLVRGRIPDGYENFNKRYSLMVPTGSVVTINLVPVEGSPLPEKAVDAATGILGYQKEDVPVLGEYYSDPPQRVVSEIKRQARRDIDIRKVREESRKVRGQDSGGKEMVDCGVCTIEADAAEDGFRYSVSYRPEYAAE